jgi:quinoprotein glucose dehydrogenase
LVKPPWGRITAIDLNTGEHVWQIPNGPAPAYIQNHPALKDVDLSNAGSGDTSGLLVTKTLLFAGQGGAVQGMPPESGGPWFRAMDKKTGEVIFQLKRCQPSRAVCP